MQAVLFRQLRDHYQKRDRLRLIVDYRRKFLESLVRGGEGEVERNRNHRWTQMDTDSKGRELCAPRVSHAGFPTACFICVHLCPSVVNTSEVLLRLCANTDPQRDSIFTKGSSDVLDHATSEIASGSKLGIDATKKLPGEGFKRPWPPLIKMDAAVKAKVEKLFGDIANRGSNPE